MKKAVCPECDNEFQFSKNPYLGQLITCPQCWSTLVVIHLSPLKLDWAFLEPLNDTHLKGVKTNADDE